MKLCFRHIVPTFLLLCWYLEQMSTICSCLRSCLFQLPSSCPTRSTPINTRNGRGVCFVKKLNNYTLNLIFAHLLPWVSNFGCVIYNVNLIASIYSPSLFCVETIFCMVEAVTELNSQKVCTAWQIGLLKICIFGARLANESNSRDEFGLKPTLRDSELDLEKDTGTYCRCRYLTPSKILRLLACFRTSG